MDIEQGSSSVLPQDRNGCTSNSSPDPVPPSNGRCSCQADSNPGSSYPCSSCRRDTNIPSAEEPELQAIRVDYPSNSDVYKGTLELEKDGGVACKGGSPKIQRKWRYFPGNNRFYCNGRVMTAPSIRFCILSFGLILITFTLFIVFDGPYLADRLTIAIPIIGSLLFISVIVNMFKTSFSDPGIIPRASQQESEYLEKSYATNNQSRPPPRTKDIVVNGQTIKSKYCFTCKMFRPPRSSHCSLCNNCVDRFDHHCPFLGNCIGKRNYRSFYAFIVSLSFLAVFILSCSIAHLALISKQKGNFFEALKESPTSAVVVIISFFGMWTVLGLAGFHTYLIAVEQTTNEDIKGLFGKANTKNPFSRGNIFQNCCFVLCGPGQPSLIDPRGVATEEFVASLQSVSEGNASTFKGNGAVTNPPVPGFIKTNYNFDGHVYQQHTPSTGSYSQPEQEQLAHQSQKVQQFVLPVPVSVNNPSPSSYGHIHQDSLISQSTDTASDMLFDSSSTIGLNRSLAEIPSESMRNLYSSIEEDPTISPDPVPVPPIPSSSRRSFLNAIINGVSSGQFSNFESDDFDDPTMIQTVSASLDNFDYDDLDDPVTANTMISGSGVRKHSRNNNRTKFANSATSLPTTVINSRSSSSNTTASKKRDDDHSSNKGSARLKNGSGKSKKISSNSTMINSPLHLDSIL